MKKQRTVEKVQEYNDYGGLFVNDGNCEREKTKPEKNTTITIYCHFCTMYDGVRNQDWATFGVNLHQQILCYNLVNSQKVVVGIEPTAVAKGISLISS